MTSWPPITDANLASRLRMDGDEFLALAAKLARRIEPREMSAADYERALGYPWERPLDSFWMEDGAVELLGTDARPAAGGEHRYPLITFGSNGAPGVLAEKLSALDPDARDVLVLTGWLRGFDVVPSAHITVYGSMPATIVAAPGVSVRAGLIMATAAQFEVLTRTEFNYVVTRIDGQPFEPDLDVPAPEAVLAYVSRAGALAVDGEDAALKAIPAEGRRANEYDQSTLLDFAARLVLGEGFEGEELVRRVFADYGWATQVARPALAAVSNAFVPEDWTLLS